MHWTLSLPGGSTVRVESREGTFVDERERTYPPPVHTVLKGTARDRVEFDEALVVPASTVKSALDRKVKRLSYVRTFVVGGESVPTEISGTLILQPASALQGVSARPERASVTPQTANSLSVRWEASLLPGITGSGLTLSSPGGVFRSPDGRVLGRVSAPLSQPISPAPSTTVAAIARNVGSGSATVTEQLTIPHSVVDAALSTGFTWFGYERPFSVAGDEATGTLRLDFTGRIASPFALERIELRFADGTRSKTVPLGEEEQAVADITFRGSGTLRGSWDVATPATTQGAAFFTRKQLVNELLSFGRRAIIRSPAIKAEQPGLYTVRLTIDEPRLETGDQLQLNFVVRATGEAMKIDLKSPQPLARLTPGMGFSWEAVGGARNYLLEIYGTPTTEGQEPEAGMVLAGAESRATLSQAAQRNFLPGRSYWWRVVALGPDGVHLGQSQLRELLTPSE